MSQEPYKRKQGDLELRVLKDGRLVVMVPDEALLEIAEAFTDRSGPDEESSGAADPASREPEAHLTRVEDDADEATHE